MGICDVPLVDKVCSVVDAIDFVGDPGKSITEGLGAWIAKSVGELAASAADLAAKAIDSTTTIDLNATWFRDNYALVLPIALTMLVGTFCFQLVRAAWRRDGQALAQAFTGTAVGVMFAFGAIAFTTVALTAVDALSDGLFKAANSSISDAVRRMIKVSQYGGMYELGWLVPTFVAIGAAIGAFLFWCVMMVRKVGILVLVTLACFAGAGGGWEAAKRWRRGWIEATATLVVSKLVMTIIFLLGVSAMGKTDAKGGLAALSDAMAGIVVMVMVLLAPYMTYKFVHWAADGNQGMDLHRSGGAGLAAASRTAQSTARKATAMSAGGAGALAAAPQGPSTVPGLNTDSAPGKDISPQAGSGNGSSSGGLEESGGPEGTAGVPSVPSFAAAASQSSGSASGSGSPLAEMGQLAAGAAPAPPGVSTAVAAGTGAGGGGMGGLSPQGPDVTAPLPRATTSRPPTGP